MPLSASFFPSRLPWRKEFSTTWSSCHSLDSLRLDHLPSHLHNAACLSLARRLILGQARRRLQTHSQEAPHTSYYKVTKHKQRLTTPNFLPKQWWSINFSKIINTHGPPFWHHPERSDLAQSCVCPSHQRAREQEPRASRNTRLRLCCATDKATLQSLHFFQSTKKETQGHKKANSTNSTTTPRVTIITFRNSAHSAMV